MANFGRLLSGRADVLPGYTLLAVTIEDAAVVALSGKSEHMIAKRSRPEDEVPGIAFEVTAEELNAADRYEVSEYSRVLVRLQSGVEAWVYVGE
jgi:Gamma-glutamyl cyclotransferase, AIG2-like